MLNYLRTMVNETGTSALPPDQVCPSCQHALEAATAASHPGATPSPGDVTICGYCGDLVLFDERLHLVPLPEADRAALEADPAIRMAQAVIRHVAFQGTPDA